MKKLSLFLACVMLLVMVPFTASASTTPSENTVYFEETFGSADSTSEDYVAPQDLATSTTVGYNGWTINTTDYESVKAQGVTMSIIVDPDDETNNILHLYRQTSGSGNSTHQLISNVSVPAQPASDTVVFSFKMKFDNTYHKVGFDGKPAASLRNDYVTFGSARFTPVGTEQTSAVSATNTWHTYELVISYTTNTTTLYIDTYQIGDVYNGTMPVESIKIYQPRGETYGYGNVWFDDFKVEWIPDPEFQSSFAEFVPATKGGLYVDGDLRPTFEFLDEDYDVTYETSDYGVIAADGTVTTPDILTTVTVTPVTTFEGETVKGKTSALVVLPENGTIRLFEDFEGMTGFKDGDSFFDITYEAGVDEDTGASLYNGWETHTYAAGNKTFYKDSWEANYQTKVSITEDNKALNLYKSGRISGKDYNIQKEMNAVGADAGDCIIISYRAYNKSGSVNICGPLFGARNYSATEWYGNFGAGEYAPKFNIGTYFNDVGKWHNYVYVLDRGTVLTDVANYAGGCYPISLYIDGNYIGTGYSKTTGNDVKEGWFQFRQFGNNSGAQDTLVDDILVLQVKTGAIQFGSSTVASGKLTGAKLQYNAYAGDAKSGVVFAAAYDSNDALVAASTGVAATANIGGGYTDVSLDLNLVGASYYRLFFLTSEAGLQPLAKSKAFPIQ